MQVTYLGGALEVGASSILLKLNQHNILLDSGIRQKKTKDKLPNFNQIAELGGVQAIVISHAHMDHIGSLPLISKEYPTAKIYMNKMTLELTRVLLYDSLKIMNYQEGEIPIFNENDVINMLDRIEIIPFQKETKIIDDITLTFYMAGHIAGASCCYLKSKEGTVFYTGDYSLFPQHTISGLSIPKLRPDIVISESTYGDKLHANREIEEMRLIDTVNNIITQGGKVLIPVFALGRSQEVLLILKKAFNKKQIKEVPVYIDGMVRNINAVFLNNPLYLKESIGKRILRGTNIFYNDQLIRVEDDNQRKKIIDTSSPCIIVSSSGMLMGGMSEYYASHLVTDANNAIILTGYQDEESNGRTLLNLLDELPEKRQIKLNDKVYPVACSIEKVGLSAHADKQEMKTLFELLKPKYLILGHGEESIIESLAKEVTKELHIKVYVPRIGDTLELDIKNPRKQLNHKLEYLYHNKNESLKDFYSFIKEHYQYRLFTADDLAYIYYAKNPTELEVQHLTETLLNTPYFTQDKRRYFLFKITDELELTQLENKEITSQELENLIKEKMSIFPYKKISYYLNEKKVILTFDFPNTISNDFEVIAKEIQDATNFLVEKNDNINNLACENVIKEIIGTDNINKISYHQLENKFKVKVYQKQENVEKIIEEKIGYPVELIIVPKKEDQIVNVSLTGQKLEQNEAFLYIDQYFKDKTHAPYKKSLKNGNIVLSFITYEIGSLYRDDLNQLSKDINWNIELNHNANMNMIFNTLESLLTKNNLEKIKNPSYLALENKVSIKLPMTSDLTIKQLKDEFRDLTGLELIIE